jgi:hypothetical protein
MRGWFFQDDGASPHRAKETKEALNAVWVTVSGANLHWPANGPDLTPIEQMSWMGKGSIHREQCNTPEELSVQSQTPLAAISMDCVNRIIESSSIASKMTASRDNSAPSVGPPPMSTIILVAASSIARGPPIAAAIGFCTLRDKWPRDINSLQQSVQDHDPRSIDESQSKPAHFATNWASNKWKT